MKKDNKLIVCEFKKNVKDVAIQAFGQLLLYKAELENISKDKLIELWLISNGTFDITFRESARKFNVTLIDDSNIGKYVVEDSVYISIEKPIVVYGEKLKIRVRVERVLEGSIQLKILNQKGEKIYSKSLIVKNNDWVEDVVSIEGKDWEMPGAWYNVIAEHGNISTSKTIWRSNFGASIELDQKVYTWTDKVFLTLIAPDFKHRSSVLVAISTKKNNLSKYPLNQINDNGIFTGEIILTGFSGHINNEKTTSYTMGETRGRGPKDGLLACFDEDVLTVSFKLNDDETVESHALIKWNIGEVSWLEASYPATGTGVVRVVDPDMNLNPTKPDKFDINIWSDSDKKGILITVKETGNATGIFEGIVNFGSISSNDLLQVTEGDTIYAKYTDKTLPDPYTKNDSLEVTGTTMIGTLCPPLELISHYDLFVINKSKPESEIIKTNHPLLIGATLSNQQNKEQNFAFFIQIQDENGITIKLLKKSGSLKSNQTIKPTFSWTPRLAGKYTITSFVWRSLDNPTALSPTLSKQIQVSGLLKQIPITKIIPQIDIGLKRKKIKIPKIRISLYDYKVSIPIGSSVPGCEMTGECFIPAKLTIHINKTVLWSNDDSAAHTITSGTPTDGPDGKFDSSIFLPGKTFLHKFVQKGIYPYFDILHPWQTGVIIVE